MEFLDNFPTVCAVKNEYQIIGCVKEYGTVCVEINGIRYYEQNSGVLPSQKFNFKISVPMEKLDLSGKYSIIYKRVLNRKKYFSVVKEEESVSFNFKALKKEEAINIYHIADVHARFELAKSAVKYFGKDLDLLILNGDMAEVESEEDYLSVIRFMGEISKGEIPVVFVRGNHDTRGKLAECFTKYFPSDGEKTYYLTDIGSLSIIALDCGEDKVDDAEVYAGLNVFSEFRKKQTEFIKTLNVNEDKVTLVVSHIPFCETTKNIGDEFDIERETYTTWCKELERIDVKFMISGHLHTAYVINKDDEGKTCTCNFPVIVGSALFRPEENLCGSAITLDKDKALIKFTDENKAIKESYIYNFDAQKVLKV